MDAHGLLRSVRRIGAPRGIRALRSAWRRHRAGATAPPGHRRERARTPGTAQGAEPRPGGGLIRFERSSLRVRVAAGGAVFIGWDDACPEPSRALDGGCPEADARAGLEPDKDGGWRVVSERVMVVVSRHGAVEIGTPGGVVLRRDLPPRWWEAADGAGGGRWSQRTRLAPDARFFGLGARAPGPRLRDGTYRLGSTASTGTGPRRDTSSPSMPVLLVVADVGTHLAFHDTARGGRAVLREGAEGSGSGHDRAGRCEVRAAGGPLRYWVITGTPSRVLRGWVSLTGRPALPPAWALGHQRAEAGTEGTGMEGLLGLRPGSRPFVLSRSSWAGMQRYGGVWSGGAGSGWAGLRASLALVLGLGLCGVPYAGAEVGGRHGRVPPELYLRWFQLGAYLPLFRTTGHAGGGRREPREDGGGVLEHVHAAARRREELLPYFLTLAHLAQRTGAPYVRPVWWHHPADRALRACEDAFLLGDALLVAPVLEHGARRRTVRVPRGRWYDTATGEAYDGPRRVELEAPLGRVPVLARAGAAIPVAEPDGGTGLEVWPPAPGRTGSGLVISGTGDGEERPTAQRLTVRLHDGAPVVTREDGEPAGYPVHVRG